MRFKKIKNISIQGSGDLSFCDELSFTLSFLFCSASTVAAYIFTALTCKATIVSLQPCALNADFQHFILRFNKISLLYGYLWKKGLGWWNESQRQDDFTNNFSIYTYTLQNIYTRSCKCIWPIFTLASCKCKILYLYTATTR